MSGRWLRSRTTKLLLEALIMTPKMRLELHYGFEVNTCTIFVGGDPSKYFNEVSLNSFTKAK